MLQEAAVTVPLNPVAHWKYSAPVAPEVPLAMAVPTEAGFTTTPVVLKAVSNNAQPK